MAGNTQQIKYELVIDTSTGQQQVREIAAGAAQSQSGGGAPAAGPGGAGGAGSGPPAGSVPQGQPSSGQKTPPDEIPYPEDHAKPRDKDQDVSMRQGTAGKKAEQDRREESDNERSGFSGAGAAMRAASILPGIASLGMGVTGGNPLAAMAGAGGSMLGGAGALLGGAAGAGLGVAGALVGGVGLAASGVRSMASDLSPYGGALFAAETEDMMFRQGLKFHMADELGPAMSDFIGSLQDLTISVLPDVISGLELLTNGLTAAANAVAYIYGKTPEEDLKSGKLSFRDRMEGAMYVLGQTAFGDGGSILDPKNVKNLAADFINQRLVEEDKLGGVEDFISKGREMNRVLFNAFSLWGDSSSSQIGAAEGARNAGRIIRDVPPDAKEIARRLVSGAKGDVLDEAIQEKGLLARPTPAAMQFKITDYLKLQAHDEDRLHEELIQFKNGILENIIRMQDVNRVSLSSILSETRERMKSHTRMRTD